MSSISTSEKVPSKRRPMPLSNIFKPHEPIPRSHYLTAVIIGIVIVFGAWAFFSYGGFVHPSYFLPTPTQVITAGARMIQTGEMALNAQASIYVVVMGWVIAGVIALPVGILIGSFKIFEALLEPIVDFMRYLPVSALIPLLILYIGIDVKEKIAVIFLGTVFQLVLMVADVTAHVAKDLLDSAYTLGASRWRVLWLVLVPATLPGVMDAFRITLGWAWTYVIVAELVAAENGLGIMIMDSQRGLRTDKIFAGLVTIGLLGFASDFILKWLHRRLLPWSSRNR